MVKRIYLENSIKPVYVDDENYELLSQFKWEAVEFETNEGEKEVMIARLVPDGQGMFRWVKMDDVIKGLDF